MVFHEYAADCINRVKGRAVRRDGVKMHLPPTRFHIQRSFPPSLRASQREMNLKEVKEFVYLGLCLEPNLSMAAAVREIKSKADKAHALVSAFPTRFAMTRPDGIPPQPTLPLERPKLVSSHCGSLRFCLITLLTSFAPLTVLSRNQFPLPLVHT